MDAETATRLRYSCHPDGARWPLHFKEDADINAECCCDLLSRLQRYIHLSGLDAADIGLVRIDTHGEFFLRNTLCVPLLTDCFTESFFDLHGVERALPQRFEPCILLHTSIERDGAGR